MLDHNPTEMDDDLTCSRLFYKKGRDGIFVSRQR